MGHLTWVLGARVLVLTPNRVKKEAREVKIDEQNVLLSPCNIASILYTIQWVGMSDAEGPEMARVLGSQGLATVGVFPLQR